MLRQVCLVTEIIVTLLGAFRVARGQVCGTVWLVSLQSREAGQCKQGTFLPCHSLSLLLPVSSIMMLDSSEEV